MPSSPTRLKPAAPAFPNGGGLKAMGSKNDSKAKDLEHKIADLQTELKHISIEKKYAPKPVSVKPAKTKRPMNNPNRSL